MKHWDLVREVRAMEIPLKKNAKPLPALPIGVLQ
jgi:hypothetical protein